MTPGTPRVGRGGGRLPFAAALLALAAVVLAATVGGVLAGPGSQPTTLGGTRFVADVPGPRGVVWAVGDGPDGGADAAHVARLVAADRRADRVLYLGDTYDSPKRGVRRLPGRAGPARSGDAPAGDNWATRFAGAYRRLVAITAPTPGNHDWPSEAVAGYLPFWRAASGRRVPAYYTFSVAGWELLSLNSEAPLQKGSTQLAWLEDQLREPGDCRIAFWHRPRFSAGERHGDEDDVEPLWRTVVGRAAVVLSGHEHNMQRFKPISGTTQFVSGAGGHGLYGVDSDDERLAFADASHFGALRLELTRGRAKWRFVTVAGVTVDAGELACTPLVRRAAPGPTIAVAPAGR